VLNKPLIATLPDPDRVHHWLGDALREVRLLRGLLRLAQLAEKYRQCDRQARTYSASKTEVTGA
jgi:hypothetical protein